MISLARGIENLFDRKLDNASSIEFRDVLLRNMATEYGVESHKIYMKHIQTLQLMIVEWI